MASDSKFSFAAVDKISSAKPAAAAPTTNDNSQFSFANVDKVLKKTSATPNKDPNVTVLPTAPSFAAVDKVLGRKPAVAGPPAPTSPTKTGINIPVPSVNQDTSTSGSTTDQFVNTPSPLLDNIFVDNIKNAAKSALQGVEGIASVMSTPFAGIAGAIDPQTTAFDAAQSAVERSKEYFTGARESTLYSDIFKGIRASSQLLATPGAAAAGAVDPTVSAKGAAASSLSLAYEIINNDRKPVDELAQSYLKAIDYKKNRNNLGLMDIGFLGTLAFYDLFGDPLFAVGELKAGAQAVKEFATFKKVGSITKDLAEGTTIANGIERTINFGENLKVKIVPKTNEIVFEGFVRRFPKETGVKGFVEGGKAAEGSAAAAANNVPAFSDIQALTNEMSVGLGKNITASVQGENLVLKAVGSAGQSQVTQVSPEGANVAPEALANQPISPELLNRLKVLSPEETSAFSKKVLGDLSDKLGVDLENLNLPDNNALIKTTRSADGRPAQINSSGKVEIFLPNLVDDIKSLAAGKTILAHDGAFATVFKIKPGESMSSLATRYISDVLTHEQAHAETISVADQSTQRALQQKVYEATASKNTKAITEAKTNLENFLRTLEDKANAYEKANKKELQKKVFGGRTIDTTDLIKKASGEKVKTIVNKSAGVVKPAEKITQSEKQILKQKLAAEAKGSRSGFNEGKKEGTLETSRQAMINEVVKDIVSKRNAITIANRKKELIAYTDLLPRASRAKFIKAINNTKTNEQFLDVISRIKKEANIVERAGLMQDIQNELKATKVKMRAGFPNVKFAYEAQKTLNTMRANLNGNYAKAQTDIAEKIADFQTKNPDALIPDELIRELQILKAVGIQDMSAAELRSVLQDIQSLKESGRTQLELERFNRDTEIDIAKEKVLDIITGGKKLPSDAAYFRRGNYLPEKKNLTEAFKKFITTGQYGFEEALDSLSQFDKNSKPYQSFLSREATGRVNDSFNTENRGELREMTKINEKVKEIYKLEDNKEILKLYSELTKPVTIHDVPNALGEKKTLVLSRDEAIKKYMELQDPTIAGTFREGLGWSDQTIEAMKSILTPEDIKFAEAQLEFYQEYYKGINEVFRQEFGVDLPFNENYSPIGRDIEVRVPESVLMAQEAAKYASVKNGSLRNRVKNNLELKVNGSLSTLTQHVVKMEHYKAWSKNITFLRKIFADKNVRQAIVDFHGKDYLKFMDNFMNDFARGGVDRGKIIPELDMLRSNVTKALLGINPKVALKQITGIFNYMLELPTQDFLGGIVNFWKSPLEKSRFLYNNSAGLAERFGEGYERDIKYAIQKNVGQQISNTRNFGEMMFALIRNADKFTVFQGSWATFTSKYKELSSGKTFDLKNYDEKIVKEAIDYTETVTNRVQETSRLDTLAPLQREGSIAKLGTMFVSQPNKMYRVMVNAGRNYRAGRGDKMSNLKRLIMAGWLLPFMYAAVGNLLTAKKYRKSAKELAIQSLFGPLQYPLVLGQIIQSVVGSAMGDRFSYQPSPLFSFVSDLQNAAKVFTGQDAVKSTTYLIDAIGKIKGIPTGVVTKAVRNEITNANDNSSPKSLPASF